MKNLLPAKAAFLLLALIAGTSAMRADDTYTQVTSIDDIDTEATYILADIRTGNEPNAFGPLDSSNKGTLVKKGLSHSNGTITVSADATVKPLEFTLQQVGNYYTLSYGSTPMYLGDSSHNTFLTNSTPTSERYTFKWIITYNDNYNCLLIKPSNDNSYILRQGTADIGIYSYNKLTTFGKTTLYKKNVVSASLASTPEFSLASGAYASGTTFTITSSDAQEIYYTTDGSKPTSSNGTLYDGSSIAITSSLTVKAVAYDAAGEPTAVATRKYSVKAVTVSLPVFYVNDEAIGGSVKEVYVDEGATIVITAADGCYMRYTTDGSTPSTSETAIQTTGNIATVTIEHSKTIKATAFYDSNTKSNASVKKFIVKTYENQMTEECSSFSNTSIEGIGGIVKKDITWTAYLGKGSSNPLVKSESVTLYRKSSSGKEYGGYMTLSAPDGFKITDVSITSANSSYSVAVNYTEGGSTSLDSNTSFTLNKNSSHTIYGLYNKEVSLFCMDENNNLIIGDISVTYVGEGTVPISAACTDGKKCYGTYSSHHAFIVPEGLTVSEIGIDDQKLNVKEYDAGSVVPANTGVMVSAATDGNKTITFTGLDGSSVLGTSNRLRATGSDGVTADSMSTADAGCKYYRLTMHDGTKIGYWWGAAEGAAFDLGANKAYLAVPNNVTVRAGFSFFDEETAIDDVRIEGNGQPADEAAAFSGCYDLQGRRVTTENKRKGLYIVGGKKLVVR